MASKNEQDEARLLTPGELAGLSDFTLGDLRISPSRRLLKGPAGEAEVEPRVMQVLVVLARADGGVVTREALFERCWGGVYVGDDSLNRAIGAARKALSEAGADRVSIETIPRTGYRLVEGSPLPAEAGTDSGSRADRFPRRAVVGGALAIACAGAAGLWWTTDRERREFKHFMGQGMSELDYGDATGRSVEFFRRALEIRPDDSTAQGLFAYAQAMQAEGGGSINIGAALQQAEAAVLAALESNPGEPNARLAQTVIQRSTLDLAANEARLRSILADDPENIHAMRHLWSLLQCTGQSREALALVERAIALKPLAAMNNYPRAQLLWIGGRNAEADRVIDRAMQYWPSHRWVRFARFTILAFTGRERAARAMLDGRGTAPQNYSPEAIALWRVSLAALEDRSTAKIEAARSANLNVGQQNLRLSAQAVMVLSALGEIDAAFEVANAQMTFLSPRNSPSPDVRPGRSTAWIFAPWLFTPPVAPMRADPRFRSLCDGIGLSDYWANGRIKPDYPIGSA